MCECNVVAGKMYNAKFANVQQAQVVYNFNHTREKSLKTNAAIWFNKM
jgi:hypothetical protein